MKPYADFTFTSFSLLRTAAAIKIRFCLGLLPLLIPTVLVAGMTNVNIEPTAFNPNAVTINVNDQVVWTWVSDFHSSTSDSGLWDSGVFNTGHVFTNSFTAAGSFPYFCVVHGFTGTVNVQGSGGGSNNPPTVAISSPTNNASFSAPATVPILAAATDSDGTVTNVAFFDGATLLGATNNTPYTVMATFAAGNHALTAVAADNGGLSTTSAVVNITVGAGHQPPTLTITSPTNNASFDAPATVPLLATAADSSGTVTNVVFYDGATLLGATNKAPYTVTTTFAAGNHNLSAVATDDSGLSTTSAVVNIVVVSSVHEPPSVTITNPPDGSVFGNTDSIHVDTSASGTGANVTNVQFFDGTALLRSVSTPPFNIVTGPFTFALGTHTLTAVALDDLGSMGTSGPIHLSIARYTPEVTNAAFSVFLIPVATNLSAPLYGMSPPGDSHRLFVLEQNGLMRIIQDGVLLPTPALDLQSLVQPPLNATNANDERGLLGLAFHPGFNDPSSPGYHTLYTYNSEMIPSNTLPTYPLSGGATNNYKNAINEWKISSTDTNIVDPSTHREVISFGKNAQNHNGGTCTFGPDGYLYLALGDGGNANDVGPGHISPGGNAQNLSVPLGKMLRFDPLNPALNPSSPDPISTNGQYRIPTNNPYQGPGQVPEIYAYGFRNPYRFAFDRVSGDLIEADVGQNNIEEINRITRGGNYGWAIKEGDFLFNMTNGPAGPAGTIGLPPGNFSPGVPAELTDPITGPMGILEYDHNNGISISGGFVYRGSAMPELYGKYIFGDLALVASPVRVNGRLFYADLQLGTMNVFTLPQFGSEILPHGQTVHGFGQDASGELYVMATDTPANGNGGVVYRLASVRLTGRVAGNAIDLSWPVAVGHLQSTTNLFGAIWTDVPNSTGTNNVSIPIDPANPMVFYRLSVP